MRGAGYVVVLLSITALFLPSASAEATCVEGETACAGEATQSPCGGPSPKQDRWDAITGAWGNVSGVEWGAGGWSRCIDTEWSAGVFVNKDQIDETSDPYDYQTIMVRFDYSERAARYCYVGFGAYGAVSRDHYYACPTYVNPSVVPQDVQDPGWGHVLG